MLGLTSIALGVLIFLSVAISMNGAVFAGARQICYGLAGSLAFLLPVIPVWGGVLLILSTRTKPSLRAWGLAVLLYLLALNLLNLLSTTGSPATSLMSYIRQLNLAKNYGSAPDAYEAFLAQAYNTGANSRMGGGLLGMLLSWPLWKVLGIVGGVIVTLLAMAGCGVLLLRLDIKQLMEKLRHRSQQHKQEQQEQQRQLTQRELNYLRQQEVAKQQAPYPPQSAPVQTGSYPPATGPVPPAQQPWPGYAQGGYAAPPATGYYPPQRGGAPEQGNGQRQEAVYTGGFVPQEAYQAEYAPMKGGYLYEEFADQRQLTQERTEERRPKRSKIFGRKNERAAAPEPPMEEPAWPPIAPQEEIAWEPAAGYAQQTGAPQSAAYTPQETPITHRLHAMQQQAPIETPAAPPYEAPAARVEAEATPPVGQAAQPTVRQQENRLQGRYQPDAPATSATARTPVLQQEDRPQDIWAPELKLPPRREGMEAAADDQPPVPIPYVYPSLALLKTPAPPNPAGQEEDVFRSQRLEETLKSFKIPARVRHVTHGPAISRFELEMAAGIKVNKVTELDRNIAMNMEVKSVRIEAPIPGKSLVGVEVPNKTVTPVTLREVLETREMKDLTSPLGVALGKDIAGLPIVCDLARMPHLLIAGATGSGKSVCVNAMINSILFRSSPEQVRMILVDPKVVELQCYNGIPHLLIPVVSDPHKAAGALSWAVTEMMERYQKFTDRGVREITGYNAALEEGERPMPRILIVIDELADLMMSCKKEVEEYICRLAQLARAAGIHLVVATQRPSVDVITGLIKANIPSRIAFKVSSNVDSRTILDRNGAEKLLGYGDMLYLPNGEFTPIRVQGCFLTDSEVNRVTDFIRQHSQADYDPDVLETLERSAAEEDGGADIVDAGNTTEGVDPLLPEAIEMAIMDGQTSISMLQRRLRIGYARAGRLIDEMTRRGVISSAAGAKPRQVLISREQFEQMSFEE